MNGQQVGGKRRCGGKVVIKVLGIDFDGLMVDD